MKTKNTKQEILVLTTANYDNRQFSKRNASESRHQLFLNGLFIGEKKFLEISIKK